MDNGILNKCDQLIFAPDISSGNVYLISYKYSNKLFELLHVRSQINILTTSMDKISTITERDVDNTIVEYLEQCITDSQGYIDEPVVSDTEDQHAEKTNVKANEHLKIYG